MNISEMSSQTVKSLESQQTNSQQAQESSKVRKQELEDEKNEVEKRNEEKAKELTRGDLEEATEKLNETVNILHEDLQFELHDESERMFAKLVDLEKHETIKEFPPEKMLDMLGRIKKAVGLIIDEKI
jgi:flagellar protein FlaG